MQEGTVKHAVLFQNMDMGANKFAYAPNWAAILPQDAPLNTMASFKKICFIKNNFIQSMLYFVKNSIIEWNTALSSLEHWLFLCHHKIHKTPKLRSYHISDWSQRWGSQMKNKMFKPRLSLQKSYKHLPWISYQRWKHTREIQVNA